MNIHAVVKFILTQKLFEITDTIADVLIHVPATTLAEVAQRIEDYLFVLDFVLLFPTLDVTRRSILLEKLERLQAMFPEVCSSASSPNMPLEFQVQASPPENDPWYQVAQSKIGLDGDGAGAGAGVGGGVAAAGLNDFVVPSEGATGDADSTNTTVMSFVEPLGASNVGDQDQEQAMASTWNHISRRLSMATFAVG